MMKKIIKKKEDTVISCFQEVVKKHPDNIAIVFNNEKASYKQVDYNSSIICRFLIDYKEQDVFFLVKPSINSVESLLGVLKSGKNCIMPNVFWEDSRLVSIINQSHSKIIFCDNDFFKRAKKISIFLKKKVKMINIDDVFYNNLNILSLKTVDNCCNSNIIAYTSGSTGEPKGVLHSQSNFVYLKKISTVHKYDSNDIFGCIFTSFSFIACLTVIFSSLFHGGRLIIHRPKTNNILDFIIKNRITRLQLTVSALRGIVDELSRLKNQKCTFIKSILVSGDIFCINDFLQFRKYFDKKCVLIVRYASTEFLGMASRILTKKSRNVKDPIYYDVNPEVKIKIASNKSEGEIIAATKYMFSRYWPENSERLRPCYGKNKGTIFLTGDSGKFVNKNKIVVLERKDTFVKINNIKIFFEELKKIVLSINGISDCFIKVKEEKNKEKYLELYYTGKKCIKKNILSPILKKEFFYLNCEPPKKIIYMKKMPLNKHFKIDRSSF